MDDHQARLLARVQQAPNGCWLWTGKRKSTGYGQTNLNGVGMNAHRAVYIVLKGAVPQGWDVDHLCRVRRCVNPDHLEAVPHAENVRRTSRYRCVNGHIRTGDNTRIEKEGARSRFRCLACRNARGRQLTRRLGRPPKQAAA